MKVSQLSWVLVGERDYKDIVEVSFQIVYYRAFGFPWEEVKMRELILKDVIWPVVLSKESKITFIGYTFCRSLKLSKSLRIYFH